MTNFIEISEVNNIIMGNMYPLSIIVILIIALWWYMPSIKEEPENNMELVGEEEYNMVERVIEKQPIILGNDAIREYERARDMNFYRERLKQKLG